VLANRVIRRLASARRLPVIDLAAIFCEDQDWANPIEPGVPGKTTNRFGRGFVRRDPH
jgi:hypothetical protein